MVGKDRKRTRSTPELRCEGTRPRPPVRWYLSHVSHACCVRFALSSMQDRGEPRSCPLPRSGPKPGTMSMKRRGGETPRYPMERRRVFVAAAAVVMLLVVAAAPASGSRSLARVVVAQRSLARRSSTSSPSRTRTRRSSPMPPASSNPPDTRSTTTPPMPSLWTSIVTSRHAGTPSSSSAVTRPTFRARSILRTLGNAHRIHRAVHERALQPLDAPLRPVRDAAHGRWLRGPRHHRQILRRHAAVPPARARAASSRARRLS